MSRNPSGNGITRRDLIKGSVVAGMSLPILQGRIPADAAETHGQEAPRSSRLRKTLSVSMCTKNRWWYLFPVWVTWFTRV